MFDTGVVNRCFLVSTIKEKHNIWFESKVFDRLERLHKKSGKSLSFLVNRAVEAYKRTEIEAYSELKKELARKMSLLQAQMKAAEDAEKASVESKKVV